MKEWLLFSGLLAVLVPGFPALRRPVANHGRPALPMKEYLYELRATRPDMLVSGPTAEELRVAEEHEAYLDRLARSGLVILYGRTENRDATAFGIVIFEAVSEDDAQAVMANDPAVRRGLLRATLFPYKTSYVRR